jgi:hypothetical protein
MDDEIDDRESSLFLLGGFQKHPFSLQIKASNWSPVDEIHICHDNLLVAITKVIATAISS